MGKYIFKHIPSAIYFDTNNLRSAGYDLNQTWFSEIISFCNNYNIRMHISELVLDEWTEYIFDILQANINKTKAALKMLKEFQVMDLQFDESVLISRDDLYDRQKIRLEKYGFNVIENFYLTTQKLIKEAISKVPPFESGGKGFRDTIIIETYSNHAVKNFNKQKVIMFSDDNAILKSGDRFSSKGINVLFFTKENILKELNDRLGAEEETYLKERNEKLLNFIKSNEPHIIEFVNKAELKINDLFLSGIGENKLKGTAKKILSVVPTKVSDVMIVHRLIQSETSPDRFPILIFLKVNVELIIDEYDYLSSLTEPLVLIQPQSLNENSPVQVEKNYSYKHQEKNVTIDRSVTIEATLDKKMADAGDFDDLQLLNIL